MPRLSAANLATPPLVYCVRVCSSNTFSDADTPVMISCYGPSMTEVVEPASAAIKGHYLTAPTLTRNYCSNALCGLTKRVVV